jgi:hypothetical protein
MPHLDKRIESVEISIEQLLKLLGGTPEQRERFWEILKGITTPVQNRLSDGALAAVHSELKSAHDMLAGLHTAAGEIREGG